LAVLGDDGALETFDQLPDLHAIGRMRIGILGMQWHGKRQGHKQSEQDDFHGATPRAYGGARFNAWFATRASAMRLAVYPMR